MTTTEREIAKVGIKVNHVACRLCGGRGFDPYSHRQSCRKCRGQKTLLTPAAIAAQDAWSAWKRDRNFGEDGPTQQDLADAVEFINSLRGATATVTYSDEL